jgi:methionine sulfoxide reductase heme-binding subunit
MINRFKRRVINHLIILSSSALVAILIYLTSQDQNHFIRISLATAYSSLLLIGVTLLIGPIRMLQKKPVQVSSDLRRDTGFWAGVHSLIHFFTGSSVMGYFVDRNDQFRFNLFIWTNYLGFIAILFLLLLLALSNDWSLKKLKAKKWKALQRSNYLLFILIIVHGAFYIIVENQSWYYVLLFALATLLVLLFQRIGFLIHKGQKKST